MTGTLPVFLLTGFLGSGKTTLLRRLVQHEAFQDTAVIVNEFGEIGLDHELMAHSSESILVLSGGCVCCAIRDDLESALRQLFKQRDAGQIPQFSRVVIETTGLADPVPIITTLLANPLASSRLRLSATITVVDALIGAETMDRYVEAAKQVAAADHLVISKCDLAPMATIEKLEVRLRKVNPWAQIDHVAADSGAVTELFATDRHHVRAGVSHIHKWVRGRLLLGDHCSQEPEDCAEHHAHHKKHFGSFSIAFDHPLDWTAFGLWLSLLLHRHGLHILRVKGLLNVIGLDAPVVIHAVQHIVHPPVHLEAWPTSDHRSRIVFVVQGIKPEAVQRSLSIFARLGESKFPGTAGTAYKRAGAGGSVAGRPIRRATAPRWLRG